MERGFRGFTETGTRTPAPSLTGEHWASKWARGDSEGRVDHLWCWCQGRESGTDESWGQAALALETPSPAHSVPLQALYTQAR